MKAALVLSAALFLAAQGVSASPRLFGSECEKTFYCYNGAHFCGHVKANVKKVNGECTDDPKHATFQNVKCNALHPFCCSGAKCKAKLIDSKAPVIPGTPAPADGEYSESPAPAGGEYSESPAPAGGEYNESPLLLAASTMSPQLLLVVNTTSLPPLLAVSTTSLQSQLPQPHLLALAPSALVTRPTPPLQLLTTMSTLRLQ
ncbi:hypothetical protein BDF22DRAFT_77021 [Syncephalis plumigaleata]|nr:hypothetical protein BDF22DRAFT_77021 [Syncephalis plumigaleata]